MNKGKHAENKSLSFISLILPKFMYIKLLFIKKYFQENTNRPKSERLSWN